jgi:Raf kinase inhibitor-like YbhB/YbcL family protein
MLAVAACGGDDGEKRSGGGPVATPAGIKFDPAFGQTGEIPRRYTCDGKGRSPPLLWSRVPESSRALALLVTDEDSPGGTFFHWSLFNFDPGVTSIRAGKPPRGALEGENSFGEVGYGPPCPPNGDRPHRYTFAIYSLRGPVPLARGAPSSQVLAAVRRLATARGQVVGRYAR